MPASAYYHRATGRPSQRVIGDARLVEQIRDLHTPNYYAYGYSKMWLARAAPRRIGRP